MSLDRSQAQVLTSRAQVLALGSVESSTVPLQRPCAVWGLAKRIRPPLTRSNEAWQWPLIWAGSGLGALNVEPPSNVPARCFAVSNNVYHPNQALELTVRRDGRDARGRVAVGPDIREDTCRGATFCG